MKYLFLSPHYDDAIYSCGGTIYEFSQQEHQVEILTLMAGEPQLPLPDTPVLKDNHQRWQAGENPVVARREEDRIASELVGAKTRYCDLLDCIYRVANGSALYPTEESLWRNIHPEDPAPAKLTELLLDEADMIFAPLGVGQHVDHLIVRNYAWQLAQSGTFPVQFYIEYPYLRNRQAVKQGFGDFPADLETIKRPISETAIQHKVKAMTAYKSQVKSFWDDVSDIDAEVRRTFSDNGQFVEQYVEPKYY